jgi:acetyl esterase/lipase
MARDRKGPAISFQVLVYPCVDYLDLSPSMKEFADGYFVTQKAMRWFWKHYASEDHARDPYLSPQHAPDLSGLPQALVITAGCDPLRDQGETYAHKLRLAGVVSWVKRYDGAIHGFFHMGGVIDAGRDAIRYAADAVAKVLKTGKA